MQPHTTEDTDAETAARDWLSKSDLRPTRQRLSLAALLVGDGRTRHVTAEGLHQAATDADVSVSLATVYNTLRAFCDAGLMNEVTVDGTRSYFDTRIDDHPHYFWEDEGHITDAPTDSVAFDRLPEPPEGAEISRIDVVTRLRKN